MAQPLEVIHLWPLLTLLLSVSIGGLLLLTFCPAPWHSLWVRLVRQPPSVNVNPWAERRQKHALVGQPASRFGAVQAVHQRWPCWMQVVGDGLQIRILKRWSRGFGNTGSLSLSPICMPCMIFTRLAVFTEDHSSRNAGFSLYRSQQSAWLDSETRNILSVWEIFSNSFLFSALSCAFISLISVCMKAIFCVSFGLYLWISLYQHLSFFLSFLCFSANFHPRLIFLFLYPFFFFFKSWYPYVFILFQC